MSLIPNLQAIQTQVQQNFSPLNEAELNWKPAENKWSIAQCIEHLIISNESYLPIFDRLLQEDYKPTFWERFNPLSGFVGRTMVKTLGPTLTKKYKAPKIFRPSSSRVNKDIIRSFDAHQEKLKSYFRQLEQLDGDKIIISSPVTKMITYSLNDALQIIAGHEQRHFNQAMNVKKHQNFPKLSIT